MKLTKEKIDAFIAGIIFAGFLLLLGELSKPPCKCNYIIKVSKEKE